MEHDWLAANMPVLGEPVPIELANTRYRDGDDVVDFLADPRTTATWFTTSPTASAIVHPGSWEVRDWRRLVELRDSIDDLLRARIAGGAAPAAALDRINRAAERVITRLELRWDATGVVRAVEHHSAPHAADVTLGRIATDAIILLAGPQADRLRTCANVDCEMLFLKHHHRRRWCHDSCGHRHRQATYYRAHKAAHGGRPS